MEKNSNFYLTQATQLNQILSLTLPLVAQVSCTFCSLVSHTLKTATTFTQPSHSHGEVSETALPLVVWFVSTYSLYKSFTLLVKIPYPHVFGCQGGLGGRTGAGRRGSTG